MDKSEQRRLAVLTAIQKNNTATATEIAAGVDVGHQRVSAIISAENKRGSVKANKAILDPDKFGLRDLFFIQVKLVQQSDALRDETIADIGNTPNVQEIHRIHGVDFDLLIKVRFPSNAEESKFVARLEASGRFSKVLRIAVMETFRESLDIDIGQWPMP